MSPHNLIPSRLGGKRSRYEDRGVGVGGHPLDQVEDGVGRGVGAVVIADVRGFELLLRRELGASFHKLHDRLGAHATRFGGEVDSLTLIRCEAVRGWRGVGGEKGAVLGWWRKEDLLGQ